MPDQRCVELLATPRLTYGESPLRAAYRWLRLVAFPGAGMPPSHLPATTKNLNQPAHDAPRQ